MKKLILLAFIAFLFLINFSVSGQNAVGIGTETPNTNAVLHLVSPGNNQGLMIPSLTTEQRTAAAFQDGLTNNENGLMVFDITEGQFYYWFSGEWKLVSGLELTNGEGINIDTETGVISNAGDLDITNEIQDLQLIGNELSITLNETPTVIDLTPYLDNQTAAEVAVTPNADLVSENVQAALVELQAEVLSLSGGGMSTTIYDPTAVNADAFDLVNHTATGPVNLNSQTISDVADPVNPQDVATKNYVDGFTAGAGSITYNNTTSALTATDIQAAMDELDARTDVINAIGNNSNPYFGPAESIPNIIDNIGLDLNDISNLSGIPLGVGNLGTFTGSTITDANDIKGALQELEIAVEGAGLNTLSNGTIIIGDAGSIPAERTITGDFSLSNTGVATINTVGGETSGDIATAVSTVNAAPALDIDATDDLTTADGLESLADVGVFTTPAAGDFLKFDGTEWVNDNSILPISSVSSQTGPIFDLTHTGGDVTMKVENNSNIAGDYVIQGESTGNSIAGYFVNNNNLATNQALYAHTRGSGASLVAFGLGTGPAALFSSQSMVTNTSITLEVENQDEGGAASFVVTDVANSADAVSIDHQGTGLALNVLSGDVDVVGNINAGSFSGDGSALTGIAINDADADPTNEIELPTQSGADAGLFLQADGAGNVSYAGVNVDDADADPLNEIELPTQTLSDAGLYLQADGSGNVSYAGVNVDDADADPLNEIELPTQTLSDAGLYLQADGSGNVSYAGVNVDDADADPLNEIELPVQSPGDAGLYLQADGSGNVSYAGVNVDDADADPLNEIELPTQSGADAGLFLQADGAGNVSYTGVIVSGGLGGTISDNSITADDIAAGVIGTNELVDDAITAIKINPDVAGVGLVQNVSGALDVNVGTGANQIVQLDGSGLLPAVDGSALQNVSAVGFSGSLAGDVSGTQGATQVDEVGGVTATNIASTVNSFNDIGLVSNPVISDNQDVISALSEAGFAIDNNSSFLVDANINNRIDLVDTASVLKFPFSTTVTEPGFLLDIANNGGGGASFITFDNASSGIRGLTIGDGIGVLATTQGGGAGIPLVADLDNLSSGTLVADFRFDGTSVANINSSGQVSAASFVGDGSGLSNIAATVNTDGVTITGDGDATALSVNDQSITGGISIGAKIAANTITEDNMALNSVSGGLGGTISDNSITADDIAAGVIGTTELVDDAITAIKINPDVAGVGLVQNVSGALDVNVGTGANQIVQLDGSGLLPAVDGSALQNVSAVGFSGSLAGDVSGTQGATQVDEVGGVTATNIASTINSFNNMGLLSNPVISDNQDVISAFIEAGTAIDANTSSISSLGLNSLTDVDLDLSPPVSGDFLVYDGTDWVPGLPTVEAAAVSYDNASSTFVATTVQEAIDEAAGFLPDLNTNSIVDIADTAKTLQFPFFAAEFQSGYLFDIANDGGGGAIFLTNEPSSNGVEGVAAGDGFGVYARTSTSNAGIPLVADLSGTSTGFTVADFRVGGTSVANINSSGEITASLFTGDGSGLTNVTANLTGITSDITFDPTAARFISVDPAVSGNGQNLTIEAGEDDGATGTGGDLQLFAGNGFDNGGNVSINAGFPTGTGTSGGSISLQAGDAPGATGGSILLNPGTGSTNGLVQVAGDLNVSGLLSGDGSGLTNVPVTNLTNDLTFSHNSLRVIAIEEPLSSSAGGTLQLAASSAFAGSNSNGGDIQISPGLGDGSGFDGIIWMNAITRFAGDGTNGARIELEDAGGANAIAIEADPSSSAYNLFLPANQGTGALTNDGSGNLTWDAITPSPWTGSPDISYTGGNVGIGISSPGADLEIRNSDSNIDLLINDQSGSNAFMGYTVGSASFSMGIDADNASGAFQLVKGNNLGSLDSLLTIDFATEEITWSTGGSPMRLLTPSAGRFEASNGTVNSQFGQNGSSGFVGTQSNHDFSIVTNDSPQMLFDAATGDIGVGTNTPFNKFHIRDDVPNGAAILRLQNEDANALADIAINFDSDGAVYAMGIDGDDDNFKLTNAGNVSAGTELMSFTNTGDVTFSGRVTHSGETFGSITNVTANHTVVPNDSYIITTGAGNKVISLDGGSATFPVGTQITISAAYDGTQTTTVNFTTGTIFGEPGNNGTIVLSNAVADDLTSVVITKVALSSWVITSSNKR